MHARSLKVTVFLFTCLLLCSCTVGRFVIYNFAGTNDWRKFPSRPLPASPEPYRYAVAETEKLPHGITYEGKDQTFDEFIEERETVAFLVIQRDTIVYERYYKGYDEAHLHASFSMAKSLLSMLIGCAIADGYITGVDQPVTDFIPELRKNGFDKVTVENLLQMTSGLDFNESYKSPFGDAATFYYGRRLYRGMAKMKLGHPPGEHFEYQSGSSQLLGWILERALRKGGDMRTITAYTNDKIWAPLGMVHPASWSIDRKKGGIEKTFCCLNAPARDFAMLGSLYLHKGNWRGKQLVPKEWVEQSTRLDTANGSAPFYQYQWWLPSAEGDFEAKGYLGQFIYVDPARELVMVRLGTNYGKMDWTLVMRDQAKGYQ